MKYPEHMRKVCTEDAANGTFIQGPGAIIRANRVEEPAQEQQPIQNPTPQPQPERVPVRETRKVETSQQELYFYEKPSKKSKPRGPRKESQQQESLSFDLAGNNNVLWNCLTAATSLIALAVGIVLLLVLITLDRTKVQKSLNVFFLSLLLAHKNHVPLGLWQIWKLLFLEIKDFPESCTPPLL